MLLDAVVNGKFSIGGNIAGFIGQTGQQLTLDSTGTRGVQSVTVNYPAASYSFPTVYQSFDNYSVRVSAFPTLPTQLCTVQNPSGRVLGDSITNIDVKCIDAYLLKGSVTGLTGTGLRLTNSGGDPLDLAVGATSFQFFTPVPPGGAYVVAVATQPSSPWQTCTFGGVAQGKVGTTDVNLPALDCTINSYKINATPTNLVYSGLRLSLNAGVAQAVNPGPASVNLGTLASGAAYTVAIAAQPAGQTCTVFGGTGSVAGADVTVPVGCDLNGYAIGGAVAGYSGSGLTLTLSGSKSLTLTVQSGATGYAFPTALNLNNTYTVAISAQPTTPWQSCTFAGGGTSASGTVSGTVTLPQITCTTNSYTVGASIVSLQYSGLQLSLNGGPAEPVASGSTSFPFGSLASGSAYSIQVISQPSGQTCTFPGGVTTVSGTVAGANVAPSLNCSLIGYSVGGTATNLKGTMTLSMTGSKPQTKSVPALATSYSFTTPLNLNDTYSVAISNPASPQQLCTFAGGATSVGPYTANGGTTTLPAITCVDIWWDVMQWDAGLWQ